VEVKQRGVDGLETVAVADVIDHVKQLRQRLLDELKPVTDHA